MLSGIAYWYLLIIIGIIGKYTLIQCIRQIATEKLANHMKDHELNDFWKDVRKHSKSKSALSNCIDGVTGETAIHVSDLWRNHYQELLNDSTRNDDDVKMDVLESFHNICSHVGMHVTMSEVFEVVKSLLSRKSSGLDGLNGESLKHADPLLRLFFYLYVILACLNIVICHIP